MPSTSLPPDFLPSLNSEHSGAFLQLIRLVDRAPGFVLVFLEYGESRYRDAVIQHLEQKGHPGERLVMQTEWVSSGPLLDALAALPPGNTPVHLLELGAWLRLDQGVRFCHLLNYIRDAFPEVASRPLLFWLDSEQLRTLALEAPDLWSWRSAVLDFSRPSEPQAVISNSSSLNIFSGIVEQDSAKQRIAAIDQYLARDPEPSWSVASLWKERGQLRAHLGDWDNAMEDLLRSRALFEQQDDPHTASLSALFMARMLRLRGKEEAALSLLRDEILPVYEKLGDAYQCAVTKNYIADFLQDVGEFDEALRISREEILPVYERFGDIRGCAITWGNIAKILQKCGELDEALRILREESLPVLEKLGDIRARAMTIGQIASILQEQGALDQALRIYREEIIPVFLKLGDIYSCAVTLVNIANIHQAHGQLDEALRILTEESLPVFEKLGASRELTMIRERIADIRQRQGQ